MSSKGFRHCVIHNSTREINNSCGLRDHEDAPLLVKIVPDQIYERQFQDLRNIITNLLNRVSFLEKEMMKELVKDIKDIKDI